MVSRLDARSHDPGNTWALIRRAVTRSSDQADPVALGRVLLVASIVLVVAGVPLLNRDPDAWVEVTETIAGLLATMAISFVLPWQRFGPRATLLFPTAVCVALVALSLSDTTIYAPLAGLLSLCFAYIGLTQPPRTALVMLPVAAPAFVMVNGDWTVPVAIRLFIGCCVWAILGEVISRSTARQKVLTTALREAAHTDVLTGVPNRRDLDLRLNTASPGDALVLCDLDHFKALNDTLGHHVGDTVLADFGAMLRATVRGADYFARYGGEEFLLLLPATTVVQAQVTLARMRAHWTTLRPELTFSAGIAACTAERAHPETLAAADRALYAAKAAGRDCDRVEPDPIARGLVS